VVETVGGICEICRGSQVRSGLFPAGAAARPASWLDLAGASALEAQVPSVMAMMWRAAAVALLKRMPGT
jgi:hypothetical protein